MHRSIVWCCLLLAACGDNADPQPPALTDLALATAEDEPADFEMAVTAWDPDAVTLSVVAQPSHGAVQRIGSQWRYTPAPNFTGDDSVVIRIDDPHGSATATVSIQITPVNDAPAAEPDSFAAGFDTPLTIQHASVLANDMDIDSSPLTVTAVAAGTHGMPALSGGTIVFAPEVGFKGVATFTYTASDGDLSAQATVTVTIGDDETPVAVGDTASTDEDTALQLADSVLVANDTDAEHHTLAISAVGAATHGTVSRAGNAITFVPDTNYFGPASFEYTVTDGYKTSVATVAITVNPVNDAPVVAADVGSTDEDAALALPIASLLENDSDVEKDELRVVSVTADANTHGTVTLAAGVVSYTPDANYNGTAAFIYVVSDGHGGQAKGTVTITIAALDDVPVAVDDSAAFEEDSSATAIDVLGNDTDVDGGAISIAGVTQPANGTVAITGDGTGLTYAPDANYCNTATNPLAGFVLGPPPPDTFTYTLSPGGATATVSVAVTCIDDAPTAVADAATVAEDSTATRIDVLANDGDIDGGANTIASVTQPANGTVTIALDGSSVAYTPSPAYCNEAPNTALDTFTYTLAPGGSSSTVSVRVTCACGKNKATDFVVGSN